MILIALSALLCVVGCSKRERYEIKASDDLIIKKYYFIFKAVTQTPEEIINMTIFNPKESAISSFVLLFPASRRILGVRLHPLLHQPEVTGRLTTIIENNKDKRLYQEVVVRLRSPLEPQQSVSINKLHFYFHSFMRLTPKKVAMFEDQMAEVRLMNNPASPYPIEQLSFSHLIADTWSQFDYRVTIRLPPLVPTFEVKRFKLNAHFVQCITSKKYVEVSHWGNLYTNELHSLHHRGSKFVGPFSNLDLGKPNASKNIFRDAIIELPSDAWGLFYRDELGNITSSQVRRKVCSAHSRTTNIL